MNKTQKTLEKLVHKYPDYREPKRTGDPFRTLISGMLSQRTKDQNSAQATKNLFSQASTPQKILGLDQETLYDLVRCSGFYRQKTKHIQETCQQLIERHEGKVPNDRESLMKLSGVGPKTADIVLSYGFGQASIPVDVHISRVTRRLGIAPNNASPEQVKQKLEKILPKDRWMFYDYAILRIGKEYCKNTDPKCGECTIKEDCEYAKDLANSD